jgi:hypothetical protein
LAHHVQFWDTNPESIGEDMHMYLKCFFATQGKLHVEPIFSPASQCNIEGNGNGGVLDGMYVRYQQAKRHMWGCLDTAYAIRKSLFCVLMPSVKRALESLRNAKKGFRGRSRFGARPKGIGGFLARLKKWMRLKSFEHERDLEGPESIDLEEALPDTASTIDSDTNTEALLMTMTPVPSSSVPSSPVSTSSPRMRTMQLLYLLHRLLEAHILIGHLFILVGLTSLIIPARTSPNYIAGYLWGSLTSFSNGGVKMDVDWVLQGMLDVCGWLRFSCLFVLVPTMVKYEEYHRWISTERWNALEIKNSEETTSIHDSATQSLLESSVSISQETLIENRDSTDGILQEIEESGSKTVTLKKGLGLKPSLSSPRSYWNVLDWFILPIGGILYQTLPQVVVQLCHLITDRIEYKVAGKPTLKKPTATIATVTSTSVDIEIVAESNRDVLRSTEGFSEVADFEMHEFGLAADTEGCSRFVGGDLDDEHKGPTLLKERVVHIERLEEKIEESDEDPVLLEGRRKYRIDVQERDGSKGMSANTSASLHLQQRVSTSIDLFEATALETVTELRQSYSQIRVLKEESMPAVHADIYKMESVTSVKKPLASVSSEADTRLEDDVANSSLLSLVNSAEQKTQLRPPGVARLKISTASVEDTMKRDSGYFSESAWSTLALGPAAPVERQTKTEKEGPSLLVDAEKKD